MFKKIFLIISLWLAPLISHAELTLELTQGMNQAIPIAISPFRGIAVQAAGGQTVEGIVQKDLNNSGQFQTVVANEAYYILKGNITQEPNNSHYTVMVELSSAVSSTSSSPVLFKKIFQVKKSELRQVAHTISDLVYQQLTGVRGVFNTKIAYILRQWPVGEPPTYALEVADVDGFNPQTLLVSPEPLMSPSWSPDGHNIAYVSFENHRAAIYLQNVFNGERRLVSSFDGINGAPAFSPDGNQMAVVLTRTGYPKIYTLDVKTLKLKQITSGYSIDTEPRWSADGNNLIFTSDRNGSPQIYRYDFSTAKINRLTYQGNYNARASLSSNGQMLVLMHRESNSFGIAKMDLVSGSMHVLTDSGVDESPSLAPNGKMVLYATKYQGRGVLAMVSIDGRIKLRLPARAGNVQEPAWSPYNL